MKTDNKTMNKTEYAEMVRGSIDSRILSEAANHTFEKRRSPASTWAAAACFALIFAAAAIFLFKPMKERQNQALSGTASPAPTETAKTTPLVLFTPVPTPDISNMRIIYGRGDAYGIDDMVHEPGTVTLYGGLNEMLADEQYNSCLFAVNIDIQDYYIANKHGEELDWLSDKYESLMAVLHYHELYNGFVRENADRYGEFLEEYYYPSEFHSVFQTKEAELEYLAGKYDEDMVFHTAFHQHLESTGQQQVLLDYEEVMGQYQAERSELRQEQANRPEEAELLKARHDAEVERLKDCGLISKEYVYDGKTMLYWLLTRDQLLNFPASPEFAYIITPAVNGDDTPEPTEAPQTWYVAADEKEELVIDFFRCIDEERFDDLAKLIAPEERAGYEAIAALAEGSRVGVRNISSVIVTEMNPYELTDDMVFAKSLEKYVGIDGARAAYRVKLDMSVYDNTGAFADETGETEQIVLLVKNAEEWFVGFWCLINDDQSSISEAQVEHIINLLAEYHAAQFTRSAEIGELKLSDNVLSDLEERQRCIEEMEKSIGKITRASAAVEWIDLAPTYDVNGGIESFTGSYLESAKVDYIYDSDSGTGRGSIMFDIMHTVTIAPDGTVLHDYFSEYGATDFSNSPLLGSGIIWTDAFVPDSYYTSDRYQYLAAAHALLAGEVPQRTDFHYGDQYVHFRLEDDGLKAYVTVIDAATGEETEVTVAIIPRDVGELAGRRLNEYWDEYVFPLEHGEDPMPEFDGFIGENYFVLATIDDTMQDLQVHCIFYFDGSEWREITGCPGLYIDSADARWPYTIHGACVLDENTALLCYYSKHLFYEGAQDNKLHIYRTENGGESWSRLDIELPDYYTNRRSYYAPLTPVFDESGQHGVIILDNGIMVNGESAPFGWLESLDGGISWEFRSLEG